MFDFHLHPARLPHPKALQEALGIADYGFVAIACEPWEWEAVAAMDASNKAFGVHPMVASQVSEDDFKKLESYLNTDPTASVGECGLDRRYPGYGENGTQEAVFIRQVELARDLRRDLQIHCVGDYGRIVALLKAAHYPPKGPTQDAANNKTRASDDANSVPRPVFHRFGGDAGIVRAALPMGAIFSLHADSFKKKSTLAALPLIPAESVQFETDADETTFAECSVEQIVQSLKERWLATKSLWDNLKV
ncbi:MAG: TatD family hydrolase [Fibrobacter sp.]|nr:TatD family hydrolase [Fibrobacter sp.]